MLLFAASTIDTLGSDASCSAERTPYAPVYSPYVLQMRVVVGRKTAQLNDEHRQFSTKTMQSQLKRLAKGGRLVCAIPLLGPKNCTSRRQGLTGDPQAAGTPFSVTYQWPDHTRVDSDGLPDEAVLPEFKSPCRSIMNPVFAVSAVSWADDDKEMWFCSIVRFALRPPRCFMNVRSPASEYAGCVHTYAIILL